MKVGAIAVVVAAVAGACGGKAERPATRPEALAACLKGCIAKVQEVAGAAASPEQRRSCDLTCGCIIDKTFFPNGEPRKNPRMMSEITVACLEGRAPASAPPSEPAADTEAAGDVPPIRGEKDLPPKSKLVLGRTLIAGTRCGKARRLPKLAYDEAHDRARLVGEELSWQLPMSWNARVERPDLLKVWGPPSRAGVYSVIELFVVPRCDGYDTQPVYERLAARGLIGLNRQAETVSQVRQRDWVGRLGNSGATEIASPVAIETPEGTKFVSLYVTQIAETKSFSVYAAAVCPVDEPPGSIPVRCKDTYSAIAVRLR